ncbi:MAG: hypothetical protein GY793_01895 [Proteobacteria bacterium]|nr:hypothetical protein [Pseudomonadota bacterium]
MKTLKISGDTLYSILRYAQYNSDVFDDKEKEKEIFDLFYYLRDEEIYKLNQKNLKFEIKLTKFSGL